ncbi:MAG: hypothetical protein H7Y06_03815, partial [Opitutaceae bacterium]|nr:hypothetical protein [Opitutaceae bacterium]
MILRFAFAPALSSATRRLSASLALASLVLGFSASVRAAAPYDLVPLNPASPNYAKVFSGVKINDPVPQPDKFKAGDEILSAVYAYLCPNSPVVGNIAYRDRLFVLLDHRLGITAAGNDLNDISFVYQAAYAYMLMKYHRPTEISASRVATYESGIAKSNNAIISGNPLLYDQGVLANLWLNGDIRLAMAVYFGGLAVNDPVRATKAQNAIDNVMSVA